MTARPGVVRIVVASELRRLVRDRRALLTALVLPMLLYPLLFLGLGRFEDAAERSLDEKEITVAYDLSALDPALAERVLARWRAPELRARLVEAPELAPTLARSDPSARTSLIGDERQLIAVARPGVPQPSIDVWVDQSKTLSNAAHDRMVGALEDVLREVEHERLLAIAGVDPAAELAAEPRDVARPEDARGRALGGLLPLLLVLMLISGGSFAALDAFAGEREAGTLETLLVQPVAARTVAFGKFCAVLLTALLALCGNAVSFYLCLRFGIGSVPGADALAGGGVALARLALGLVVFLPTAVLIAAVLCLLSARAQSFREGQHYIVPLTFLVLALAAPARVSRVELDWFFALVPITGSALAAREALSGTLGPALALLSLVASSGWAALALGRLSETLDAERLLRSRASAAESALRRLQSRRALGWGIAAVALVYVVGGRLQSWHLTIGIVLTLWALVPALAVLSARGTARRAGEPWWRPLGLRAPRPLLVLAAFFLAPPLAVLATELFTWQGRVLPVPQGLDLPEITSYAPLLRFFLLALSPGLMEELLFRGAILSGLARDLPARKVVLFEALLFGAVHASIYRFLPTALLGTVLAALTLRARSIWPAVALHTTYNALFVLEIFEGDAWERAALLLLVPGLALLALDARRR